MTSVTWRDLIAVLSPDSKSKSGKCTLRLLDTVFIDSSNKQISWYFTTKSGYISKKKSSDNISVLTDETASSIVDRFSRFALANPNNKEKLVGVFIHGNGYRQILDATKLHSMLTDNAAALSQENSFLQVYLRPYKGVQSTIVCKGLRSNKEKQVRYTCSSNSANGHSYAMEEANAITNQVTAFAQVMCTHIRKLKGLYVNEISIECVVDDNEHVWLSNVPVMRLQIDDAMDMDNEAYDESHLRLQNVGSSNDDDVREVNSKVTSLNLPNIQSDLHTSSIDARSRPVSSDSSSHSELLIKEGATYKCPLGPDDLPGLKAWSLMHMSTGENLRWSIDMDSYTQATSASPLNPAVESIRRARAATRHNMPYLFISLIKKAEKLLLGKEAINDADSFQKRWQSIHETIVNASTINVIAVVCGNTNAICKKLESLLNVGFQDARVVHAPYSSPTQQQSQTGIHTDDGYDSEGNANSSSSNSISKSRPRTEESNRQVIASNGQDYSAASNDVSSTSDGRRVTSAGGNRTMKSNLNVSKEDILGLVSSGAVGFKPTTRQAFGNNDDDGDADATSSAYNAKAISKIKEAYGKSSKKSSKKPVFRRDVMEQPPMVEKYVAEKENQKKQMFKWQQQQQQNQMDHSDADVYSDSYDTDNNYGGSGSNKSVTGNRVKDKVKSKAKSKKRVESSEFTAYIDDDYAIQQLQQYSYPTPAAAAVFQPNSSIMSSSEADFMLRQVQQGDMVSVLADNASVTSYDSYSMRHNTNNTNTNTSSVMVSKVNDAMKERIETLEKQNAYMATQVRKKEEDCDRLDQKLRRVGHELESIKKSASKEMQLLIESHEKDIIKMREVHAKEMANITLGVDNPDDHFPIPKRVDKSYEANKHLLHQLEVLQNEQRKLQLQIADERRNLTVDSNTKLISQERQYKAEIALLKGQITAVEDKLLQKEDELMSTISQTDGYKNLIRQLEMEKSDAVTTANKLRADLRNMQQSAAASYKLESSQSIGVGIDADTAIRINEATIEAKTRTLSNKVEFLKAQLGAEQAAMEEMRDAAEANRKAMDDMKSEFRYQLQEAEQLKRKAIEDTERRVEGIYEERMSELTTLQTRMMLMQGQLNEAFQENAMAKQQVESSKQSNAKAASQQAVLKTEIEQLRVQVNELRQEKEEMLNKDLNKHSQEAIIRRLDNERQYLKSQLGSEITHKNELQTALTSSQTQLNNVQTQWKIDVDTLKENALKEGNDRMGNDQRMTQAKLLLEAEVSRLTKQNKDLKDAFTSARDQVRMEQLQLENATTANTRMSEQLEDSKFEIQMLHNNEIENNSLHQQQLSALRATLNEQDEKRMKQIADLKGLLSGQYMTNSEAQKELLEMRKLFEVERGLVSKRLASDTIVKSLNKMKHNRIAAFFRVWHTNITLLGVAVQYRGHVNTLINDTVDEERGQRDLAMQSLRAAITQEKEAEIQAMLAKCDRMILNSRKDVEREKDAVVDQLKEELALQLAKEVEAMNAKIDDARDACRAEMDSAMQQKDVEIEEVCNRYEADAAVKRQQYLTDVKNAIEATKVEVTDEWKETLQQREQQMSDEYALQSTRSQEQHQLELQQKMLSLYAEFDSIKKQLGDDKQRALDDAYDQRMIALHQQQQELQHDFTVEKQLIQQDYQLNLQSHKEQWSEASEVRMRAIREEWEEELRLALADKDEQLVVTLREKMYAHEQSFEAERMRGIKLEASKWRQALKDAEKRFHLECERARSDGIAEEKANAERETLILNNIHTLAMQKQSDVHKLAFDSLVYDHNHSIQQLKDQLQVDMTAMVHDAEVRIRGEVEIESRARHKKEVDNAWADSAAMWEAKLAKEANKLNKFKHDVTQQMQYMAQERTDLLDRLSHAEEGMQKIDDVHRAERSALRDDFAKEKEAMLTRFNSEKKSLQKELEAAHSDMVDQMDSKLKAENDRRLRVQKETLTHEMDKQMKQLQDESEKLIVSLEHAMGDLKREKLNLTETLTTTTTKLEDTEDTLYDCQKEMKAKEKEYSLAIWKLLSKSMTMKCRYEQGMTDFEREYTQRAEKMRKIMQGKIDEMTLITLKLSLTVHEGEKLRKSTHNVFVTHKVSVLADTRTKIKLLEKEIERLQLEKDSLEEQRDVTEEEIEKYEGQVRDIEDQIREHNRNSSMANGRVNVAHARKKRRLDSELERLLETIETKRAHMGELDERSSDKSRQREEKENDMIDLEKLLVQVLVEQQRIVVGMIEDARMTEEKAKVIVHVARLPWPPPADPTLNTVAQINQRWEAEDKQNEAIESRN